MLQFPNIKKVTLKNFKLFENFKEDIEIDLAKSISCIIGANGLGKSTILNSIIYALTGQINCTKIYSSVKKYYDTNKVASAYFSGRIGEDATVKVEFELGSNDIAIERNFNVKNSILKFVLNDDEHNSNEYEMLICSMSGFAQFSQFVYFMHKVILFDENRECIFWSGETITPILYLVMGISPDDAEKADNIAQKIRQASSIKRNLQYEISKLSKRLQTLLELTSDDDDSLTKEEYNDLNALLDEEKNKFNRLQIQLDHADIKIAEYSISIENVEIEYNDLYETLFSKSDLSKNNIVKKSLNGNCPICNSNIDVNKIKDLISKKVCPLCNTKCIDREDDNKNYEMLDNLDKKLMKLKYSSKETIREKNKILVNIHECIEDIKEIENKLDCNYSQSNSAVGNRIEQLNGTIRQVQTDKDIKQKEIDDLQLEHQKYVSLLENNFYNARLKFVPIFREYAKAFLGMDIDIGLISSKKDLTTNFSFTLNIDETSRTSSHQLSESQKFFIDIALRMSLIDYIKQKNDVFTASILVDTPEGSLDIAYETNAGILFHKFASQYKLIFTANANSSGLVTELARRSSEQDFNLIEMIRWASLSRVQLVNIRKFDEVIDHIYIALGENYE